MTPDGRARLWSSVRIYLSTHRTLLKWSAMAAAIVWVLVYRLSEDAGRIPDFVYVNF